MCKHGARPNGNAFAFRGEALKPASATTQKDRYAEFELELFYPAG